MSKQPTPKAPTRVTPQAVSRLLAVAQHAKATQLKSSIKGLTNWRAGFRVEQIGGVTRVHYEVSGHISADHRKMTLNRYVSTLTAQGYRAVIVDGAIPYVEVTLPEAQEQVQ